MSENVRSLDSIRVGARARHDMGDIEGLAESMRHHGLLHPIVITSDGVLVAGQRRLEAARRLGWEGIDVTVVSVKDMLSAERDENTVRKDFTPTELVAIGELIEAQERPAARERLREASRRRAAGPRDAKGRIIKTDSTPTMNSTQGGLVVDIAAKALGVGRSKYEQAKHVVKAAAADPERFGDLPAQMDEMGSVHTVHAELQRRRAEGNGKPAVARSSIHAKKQYPKPNREMQRAVTALQGICLGLQSIDVKQLDADKVEGWALALSNAAATLRRLSKGMVNDH